jgi:NAD-dependent dihydropyrimidine dehydrogenase PreA subunit
VIAHVFPDRCIGCGTCIEACPTHVFDAGEDGRPIVARLDACQTCFMCELYCPADALYVATDQHGAEAIDPDAILASGELGSLRRGYRWTEQGSEPGSLDLFWRLGPLLREGADTAARRYQDRRENRSRLEPHTISDEVQ